MKGGEKMVNHRIKEGLSRTVTLKTRPSHAYVSNSSTIAFLLSTPALIAMIIDISCQLLHDLIPAEYTTVGYGIQLTHENPTVIGEKITFFILLNC